MNIKYLNGALIDILNMFLNGIVIVFLINFFINCFVAIIYQTFDTYAIFFNNNGMTEWGFINALVTGMGSMAAFIICCVNETCLIDLKKIICVK